MLWNTIFIVLFFLLLFALGIYSACVCVCVCVWVLMCCLPTVSHITIRLSGCCVFFSSIFHVFFLFLYLLSYLLFLTHIWLINSAFSFYTHMHTHTLISYDRMVAWKMQPRPAVSLRLNYSVLNSCRYMSVTSAVTVQYPFTRGTRSFFVYIIPYNKKKRPPMVTEIAREVWFTLVLEW